ncbi:MAG: hypothetical protein KGZ94_00075 [Clostridia bacterium]|nr:hypothetical protein [Clostridia bacterium]
MESNHLTNENEFHNYMRVSLGKLVVKNTYMNIFGIEEDELYSFLVGKYEGRIVIGEKFERFINLEDYYICDDDGSCSFSN